jgi:hypothetical protein
MLDSLSVLHEQWREAQSAASSAEGALMDALRQGTSTVAQVEHVRALRSEASRLLREFLAEVEVTAASCRVGASARA